MDKIKLVLKGLKSEWNRIIFPTGEKLVKDSIKVFVASIIIGLLIFGLDNVIEFVFSFILK